MNRTAGHDAPRPKRRMTRLPRLLAAALLALPLAARPAALQLTPAAGDYQVGDDVVLVLAVDTEGADVVAADARISFDPAVLSLRAIDLATSGFAYDFGLSKPALFPLRDIDNDGGAARILVALPSPGVNGQQVEVARLVFRALAASAGTQVRILPAGGPGASAVIVDDGQGTDALAAVTDAGLVVADFADSDGDGVYDHLDNCTLLANADQTDVDGDGYGNRCDADFNNDGIVNAVDLALFKKGFLSRDPLRDINSDGIVNAVDLALFKKLFLKRPGPSGLAP